MWRRSLLAAALAGSLGVGGTSSREAFGQQPAWRPQRVPNAAASQPLTTQNTQQTATTANEAENLGSGVVLRWTRRTSSPSQSTSSNAAVTSSDDAFASPSSDAQVVGMSAQRAFNDGYQAGGANAGPGSAGKRNYQSSDRLPANPLRLASGYNNASSVTAAAYQQDSAAYPQDPSDAFTNPFGDAPPEAVPPAAQNQGGFPDFPGNNLGNSNPDMLNQNSFAPNGMQNPPERLPSLQSPPAQDPLDAAEEAPNPNSILETPPNPFPGRDSSSASDRSQTPELIPRPSENEDGADQELDLPKRRSNLNSLSCNELRDEIRSRPITNVRLDPSPAYGEGLSSVKKDNEEKRLAFAATSEIRDWHDYNGRMLATGRLINLRDDRVILDVGGQERAIPMQDLSDVDVAYVGESWNIPAKCGTGSSAFDGRQFVASTVQWKAPGHCHKPLYFEQVQLERYGHETGPVLQPLISTAHFFGNIAVLPYKMGIHPPNECQYSLGYYRPGNCAPYMVQPIPLSLRGAALQAGVVTGAAALIP